MNFKLQNIILERGITQRILSDRAKVPEGYISEVIHGKRILSEQHQTSIAKALGKRREDIFQPWQNFDGYK